MDKMFEVDMPKNQSSIIKVIGVGGGGSNAVTHMYNQGIQGVDFIICNTDAQALKSSAVPVKIQLGNKGLGAGSIPAVGKESALENLDDIKKVLGTETKMVFITAGMGGGTGTGAAPVIAEAARDMDILTVGIVTIPFLFEGRKRRMQAESGIQELRKYVDSLLIISNDKLREVHGDLKLTEAFHQADDILTVAARGIAELITVVGHINVDFEDVRTVMKNSGTAIMGSATAEGDKRAVKAIREALESPLLNDSNIKGADNILLYIASGSEEITMDEVTDITDYIQNEAGSDAEIIWGNGIDESLGDRISVTLIATGFDPERVRDEYKPGTRVVIPLQGAPEEKEQKAEEIKINHEHKEEEHAVAASAISEITLITRISGEDREQEKKGGIFMKSKEQEEGDKSGHEDLPRYTNESHAGSERFLFRDSSGGKDSEKGPDLKRNNDPEQMDDDEKTEIEKKSQERIKKLKDLSIKLKSPKDLAEYENVPAYIRRNVPLNDVKHSSESEISRFSLGEGEDSKTELRSENPYIHDTVD
ncbi:MAG: cell division protein FtsZ [Bacteroidales bacterium]|nr:cell division protein FtsZ [Bacteroidales bacterium]